MSFQYRPSLSAQTLETVNILRGDTDGAAFHLDHHAGHADGVDQIRAGLAVLAFILGLFRIDADHQKSPRDQGVNEIESIGSAILPPEEDMFTPDMVFPAEAGYDTQQEIQPIPVVLHIEDSVQLTPHTVADNGGVNFLGIVEGHTHDL